MKSFIDSNVMYILHPEESYLCFLGDMLISLQSFCDDCFYLTRVEVVGEGLRVCPKKKLRP